VIRSCLNVVQNAKVGRERYAGEELKVLVSFPQEVGLFLRVGPQRDIMAIAQQN
jgi:hypothetical protein